MPAQLSTFGPPLSAQASEQQRGRFEASPLTADASLFSVWRDASFRTILGALLALAAWAHRKKLRGWLAALFANSAPAEVTGYNALMAQRQRALAGVKKAAESGAHCRPSWLVRARGRAWVCSAGNVLRARSRSKPRHLKCAIRDLPTSFNTHRTA